MVSVLTSTFYCLTISIFYELKRRLDFHLLFYWLEYIFIYSYWQCGSAIWVWLWARHHHPIVQVNFISTGTIFILRQLGPLPLISSCRGPLSPGTHPQPLQGPGSTESKRINSVPKGLSEGTDQSLLYIYQYIDLTKLWSLSFSQCTAWVISTIPKHDENPICVVKTQLFSKHIKH